MNKRRWLMIGWLLATLAVSITLTSASGARECGQVSGYSALAAVRLEHAPWEVVSTPEEVDQASEQYLLVASELGYVIGEMQSGSYSFNRDVAVQAEGAPPIVSENYHLEGIVRYWVGVPLVLRNFR